MTSISAIRATGKASMKTTPKITRSSGSPMLRMQPSIIGQSALRSRLCLHHCVRVTTGDRRPALSQCDLRNPHGSGARDRGVHRKRMLARPYNPGTAILKLTSTRNDLGSRVQVRWAGGDSCRPAMRTGFHFNPEAIQTVRERWRAVGKI